MNQRKYTKSKSLPITSVRIDDDFWNDRLKINNEKAIFYQWEKLEETHNQDNFRLVAKEIEGYRFGFFYCDSDLHKWADAAARILITTKNDSLAKLVQEYIELVAKAQEEDGYLFTYNQFHFPCRRWANLQIEHELYCLGHLIEAAVSYYLTEEPDDYKEKFLAIATKAADLLVKDMFNASPKYTPGHQEIEIALIRLYRLTRKEKYLDLAAHFLYQRGKMPFFGLRLLLQVKDQNNKKKKIDRDMRKKNIENKFLMKFFQGETKQVKEAPLLSFRSTFQFLSGRYHQQNKPVTKMTKPIGHAVRWGYLVTAMAMLYQEKGDNQLLKALKRTWENMVEKHLFITGGLGALAIVEGFGRAHELNSSYCYCETCAAIASILFNWEMALITNEAKYADLLEWQLYNALNVGISLDGTGYLYRNLLESDGSLSRKDWFATPCCPSNISRIWASLGKFIYSYSEKNIWLHQFIGNSSEIIFPTKGIKVTLHQKTELPWNGKTTIFVEPTEQVNFTLFVRIPSWAEKPEIIMDGIKKTVKLDKQQDKQTASGFFPNNSFYYPIARSWEGKTKIIINFSLDVKSHFSHPSVKSNRGKIAISRGPIVYCFESIDNPEIELSEAKISFNSKIGIKKRNDLLPRMYEINTKTTEGQTLVAIPYFCWANRGVSKMRVWIDKK
jgi:hypothetical protein